MKQFLFTSLISLFLITLSFAQVIDDSDLKKLKSGQYQIEEGMIQVSFSDTVSADHVELRLSEYGYEILNSNFQNILLTIQGEPIHEQLKEVKANKWVESLVGATINTTEKELKESQNTNPTFISLVYNATSSEADELISAYPDLDLKIVRESQRSAVIKTEPGREAEVMEALDQLSFVKSTALIGVIE